jgi:PKD repeat protein
VFDASGNPLPGVPVTFITNAGTFSNPVVLSDSGGAARTTLTTSQAATVTASAGSATSGNVTINVAARPTVTLALSGTTPPIEGGVTTFAITAAPAAGGAPIERVTINYGDGSSDELGSVVSSAQHVYQNDGSYTVTLTATDTSGVSTTASIVIEVQAFVVTITAVQSSSGTSFTFTANVPAGLTMASFSWNFGDTVSNTTTTTTNTAQHEYGTRSGPKTVRVTARTTTNETAQGSITIVVP